MARVRLLLTLGALLVACFALAPDAAANPSKQRWKPCFVELGPFECTIVAAPLDYDAPHGPRIGLSLVRLPATDQQHRIGSLFLNPGGPGGSGVDFTVFAGPFLYTEEVRARFDLVGFDPRGIVRSKQLRCFGSTNKWEPAFAPFAFPMTPEEEQIWMAADAYLAGACDQNGGKIIDHMATANAARDLDVMRQALGDEKLTYAGYSYGSYLGVTYANLFPDKVRALIVDGVLDPVAWATGTGNEGSTIPFSTRLHSDIGAQATLNEFLRLCDAGGPACAFAPNASARYAALLAQVKAHPFEATLPDGTPVFISYANLIGFTLGAMYDSSVWESFAQDLAAVEVQAVSSTAAARLQELLFRPAYHGRRGFPKYQNFLEGFPGVACADTDNPDSYSAWSSAAAASDAIGYFGRLWTWITSICAVWPGVDADRYVGPFTRHTANPVLVVGNLFDPATPYHGAVTVDNLLPNSALLTVHGWGHTSLFLSQCADAVATRYLVDVAVPPLGTVCEQDHVPFTP